MHASHMKCVQAENTCTEASFLPASLIQAQSKIGIASLGELNREEWSLCGHPFSSARPRVRSTRVMDVRFNLILTFSLFVIFQGEECCVLKFMQINWIFPKKSKVRWDYHLVSTINSQKILRQRPPKSQLFIRSNHVVLKHIWQNMNWVEHQIWW